MCEVLPRPAQACATGRKQLFFFPGFPLDYGIGEEDVPESHACEYLNRRSNAWNSIFCRADQVIFSRGFPSDYDVGKQDGPEICKQIKKLTPGGEGAKAGFDAVGGLMTFAVRHKPSMSSFKLS